MTKREIDWSRFAAELDGIRILLNGNQVRAKSKDFFWYSPILNEQLKDCVGDLVVMPRTEAEVIRVAAAVARWRVPLTIRGAGTGNYGQCVPLAGGVILDTTELNQVLAIRPGSVRVQTGARIAKVLEAVQEQGQELLMFPSTLRIATIGGFIAGGSLGVGSIRNGALKDAGNVTAIRVVTVEPEPRIIELLGADIQKVHHAYGTNGIITELELCIKPAFDWQHNIMLFDHYTDALRFCKAASTPELDLFLLTSVDRNFAPYYEELLGEHFPADRDAVFAMVAPQSLTAYRQLALAHGGRESLCMSATELEQQELPPAYECAYNHTTLHAIKVDKQRTYLQYAMPSPLDPDLCQRFAEHFGDEVYWHHEFARQSDAYQCFGIPLVRFSTAERLYEVMAYLEQNGCAIFDPHVVTIEDGGIKEIDDLQIEFKKLADPYGLLNPGKTRGWDQSMARQN
ncbi:FAD-binding oxidoreductase [Herbaspirillum autotrophicum]|uniref:FAD-binding oxidoreductase n=1 Tax=Herbaspirillum autotrophicum TaxID=180195 RepID=UPI00067DCD24|nr:FAD-binding oxidoreductase [Herbaspirillum autotrophicum]